MWMGGVPVVKLIARTPCSGLLPVTAGNCTLSELTPEAITSISLVQGQMKAVSEVLNRTYGFGFPAANRVTSKGEARCIWVGQGQAVLFGAPPVVIKGASITDQTDGWAVLQLQGKDATDVLARLVPVDLRSPAFKNGHTARTLLFHMPVSITRSGANSFDLMVFRSMAVTAVHELQLAMKSAAALSL